MTGAAQDALARLLLDPELRRRFVAGRDELGLSPDELELMRAIDPRELERVAASLRAKRRRAVEATVPHCARLWPALGQRYVELLERDPVRAEHVDPILGPGASELSRRLARLQAAARADIEAPVWIVDLLALELARACTRRDAKVRALRCGHPVHELLLACDRGWLSVDLEPRPHEYRVEPTRLRWRALEGAP